MGLPIAGVTKFPDAGASSWEYALGVAAMDDVSDVGDVPYSTVPAAPLNVGVDSDPT
jgi:hypothetical protein